MEHYGLLADHYVDPITGDFTTKLSALHILHWTEEYCGCFLMKLLPPLLHKCLPLSVSALRQGNSSKTVKRGNTDGSPRLESPN